MSQIENSQKLISEISDDTLRAVVSDLVAGLRPHLNDLDEMWTFSSLSKLIGISPDDPLLVSAIRLLATGERARLLDMHFLYFDPDDDESQGEKVEDEAVARAYKSGFLIDPRKGIEVREFEDAIVPYFTVHGAPGHG